ncbi:MAG TPA: alpha/beta fold hydrolase [Noviherbaspirillum sp.]|nr:alpha/beta fold hydrolase [Noviherbaspirillum sp.]
MAMQLVHFVHGKESGPWGGKITALAETARGWGWEVESLDYSSTMDPAARLETLVRACHGWEGDLVLVGSSMGGWVAAEAASRLRTRGVFLLAPALNMPAYPSQNPPVPADAVEIVHGWRDEVIPHESVIQFARDRRCMLHLVDGDHRLNENLPILTELFGSFLRRLGDPLEGPGT